MLQIVRLVGRGEGERGMKGEGKRKIGREGGRERQVLSGSRCLGFYLVFIMMLHWHGH